MDGDPTSVLQTTANEELILSLLDRYIDVTNSSFGELSKKFYEYTPERLVDLKYHGRQVSFYLKRERPISPNHWHGIAEFVYSDEFIEVLPEARTILRQQEAAIEAAVYFSKLFGLSKSKSITFPEEYCGYWEFEGSEDVFIKFVPGHKFVLIHGNCAGYPNILSGFIFPRKYKVEDYAEVVGIPLGRNKSWEIFDVYLWDRLSREKLDCDKMPLIFDTSRSCILTGIWFDPQLLSLSMGDICTRSAVDMADNGRLKTETGTFAELFGRDLKVCSFCNSDDGEYLWNLKNDNFSLDVLEFFHFIDKNVWGVLGGS